MELDSDGKKLVVICGSFFDVSIEIIKFWCCSRGINVIELERISPSWNPAIGQMDPGDPDLVVGKKEDVGNGFSVVCDWAAPQWLLEQADMIVFFALDAHDSFSASVANRQKFLYAKLMWERCCRVYKRFEEVKHKSSLIVNSNFMREKLDDLRCAKTVAMRIIDGLEKREFCKDLMDGQWRNFRAPKVSEFRFRETDMFGLQRSLNKAGRQHAISVIRKCKTSAGEEGEQLLGEACELGMKLPAVFHAAFNSVLILEIGLIKNILKKIEHRMKTDTLEGIEILFKPLFVLSTHFIHRHTLFLDTSPLLVDVMRTALVKVPTCGYPLLLSMLKADFSRYIAHISKCDAGAHKNTARALLDNFHAVLSESGETKCQWKNGFTALGKVLHGSLLHCSVVTEEDVNVLITVALTSSSVRLRAGAVCALSSIFEYCEPRIVCVMLPRRVELVRIAVSLSLSCRFQTSERRLLAHFVTLLITTEKQQDVREGEREGEEEGEGVEQENIEEVNELEEEVDERVTNFVERFLETNLNEDVLEMNVKRMDFMELRTRLSELEEENKEFHNLEMLLNESKVVIDQMSKEKDVLLQRNGELERIVVHLQKKVNTQPVQNVETTEQAELSNTEEDYGEIMTKSPNQITGEEAYQFVQRICTERTNLKSMRQSICNSLKHLGSALYASQNTFIFELIQNVNDCTFDTVAKPTLIITVENDALFLQTNETGFRAKDVLSISSLCLSSKKAGQSVGNKGLGFKAVFSCSDRVYIKSNNFCFGFLEGKDEVDTFLTPRNVKGDDVPFLANEKDFQTQFYLPLKERHIESDFLDSTLSLIQDTVLLCLKNLGVIHIIDKRNKTERKMVRTVSDRCVVGEGVERMSVAINEKRFLCFEKEISEIPEHLFDCDSLRDPIEATKIAIFVETDETHSNMFCLHAGLPVGSSSLFPFLIAADFELVSSRENLRDNLWNKFLLGRISSLFAFVATNDSFIQEHLSKLTPKKEFHTQLLYETFIASCRRKLAEALKTKFQELGEVVISDDWYCPHVLSVQQMKDFALLNVVHGGQLAAQINELKLFRAIEMKDVLKALEGMQAQFDDDVWNRFFEFVKRKDDPDDFSALKNAPIWCVLKERRGHVKKLTYVDADVGFDWRPEVCHILSCFQSDNERSVAVKCFEILSVDKVLKMIFGVHLFSKDTHKSNYAQIEKDAQFICQNIERFEALKTKFGSRFCCSVCTVFNEVRYSMETFSPFFCGILLNRQKNMVKPIPSKDWFQRLRFERSLQRLGVKYCMSIPVFSEAPILPAELFEDVEKALLLLEVIEGGMPEHLRALLPSLLLVKSRQGHMVEVGTTASEVVFGGDFEYETILLHSMFPVALAELLNIQLVVSVASVQNLLDKLTREKVRDARRFISPLLRLNRQKILDQEVCLFLSCPSPRFVSIQNVIVNPANEIAPACKVLCDIDAKYGLVNQECNSTYLVCDLQSLGAASRPSLTSLSGAVNMLERDPKSFEEIGVIEKMLTPSAVDKVLTLFEGMEALLGSSFVQPSLSMEVRASVVPMDVMDCNVPVLCIDRRLRRMRNKSLRYTLNGDIAAALMHDRIRFELVDIGLAVSCPFVLKALEILPLEDSCVIRWHHPATSTERFYLQMSKAVRRVMNDDEYACFGNRYCQISLLYDDVLSLDVSVNPNECRSTAVVSTSPYFVFGKNVVVCNDENNVRDNESQSRLFFVAALIQLLRVRRDLSKHQATEIAQTSLSAVSVTPQGVAKDFYNKPSHAFRLIDFISSNIGNDSTILDEIISFSDNTAFPLDDVMDVQDAEKFFNENVAFDAVPRNEIFFKKDMDDIVEIQSFKKKDEDHPKGKPVNQQIIDEVGIVGEHFVHVMLSKLYGQSYSAVKNWVSSIKKTVLGISRNCDDSLGYDFEIMDVVQRFVKKKSKMARVYIEVKSCGAAFDGTFYFSANESSVCSKILASSDSFYVLLFVEHCSNPSQTRMYGFVNVTTNPNAISLSPSQFVGTLVEVDVKVNKKQNKHKAKN